MDNSRIDTEGTSKEGKKKDKQRKAKEWQGWGALISIDDGDDQHDGKNIAWSMQSRPINSILIFTMHTSSSSFPL